mgnify:CR=1 FL=1
MNVFKLTTVVNLQKNSFLTKRTNLVCLKKLKELRIKYRRIRPFTTDDFKNQLKVHLRKYNNFPMRPLGWLSPKQYLLNYHKLCLTSL